MSANKSPQEQMKRTTKAQLWGKLRNTSVEKMVLEQQLAELTASKRTMEVEYENCKRLRSELIDSLERVKENREKFMRESIKWQGEVVKCGERWRLAQKEIALMKEQDQTPQLQATITQHERTIADLEAKLKEAQQVAALSAQLAQNNTRLTLTLDNMAKAAAGLVPNTMTTR